MLKIKLKRFFNLRINAYSASFENQNIGPNLSPYMSRDKINLFCLNFNEITSSYLSNEIEIYVRLNLYNDNSFNFIIKGPKFPFLIKLFYDLDKLEFISKLEKNTLFFNLLKLISIKNYFYNKNFNYYIIINFLLKIQFKALYFSIKKYI